MEKNAQMLEMVSRTFALSIKYLPGTLRDVVGLAYLLFRVSDCLEDHAEMSPERKVVLLELWEQVLRGNLPANEFVTHISDLDANDPEVYVALQAESLMDDVCALPEDLQCSITTRCARSTLGMARWQREGPYVETVEALDDYMHQVAGRVGYLMTDIFAWYSPQICAHKERLMPLSRESGLGLQSVNVIRGLRKDYERGWVFVPRLFLERVGIDRDQFFQPDYEDKAVEVVNMLAYKAEQHLRYGLEYIAAFPARFHRVRLACMWPLFFAVKTLALSRENVEVVRSEVKITRQDIESIIRQTTLFGWSNRWLHQYYETLNSSPN